MSKRSRIMLGVASVLPLLLFVLWVAVSYRVVDHAMHVGAHDQTRQMVYLTACFMAGMLAWAYGVAVFCIRHMSTVAGLTNTEKRSWKLLLLFAPFSAIYYWYRFIWRAPVVQ